MLYAYEGLQPIQEKAMLQFDPNWRFDPPGTVDKDVAHDILQHVIGRTVASCGRKQILEVFKRRFAQSIGTTTGTSSSESWAESDLETYMSQSADQNAALFAEALHDGLMDIASMEEQAAVPPWDYVNRHLAPCGFAISPPNLVLTAELKPIPVPHHVPSLDARANQIIHRSLNDS